MRNTLLLLAFLGLAIPMLGCHSHTTRERDVVIERHDDRGYHDFDHHDLDRHDHHDDDHHRW